MNWLLPVPASGHAAEIDTIMLLVHSLMLALAVGWGGVFVYSLIRFRRSRQPRADYHGAKSRYSTYTEAGHRRTDPAGRILNSRLGNTHP